MFYNTSRETIVDVFFQQISVELYAKLIGKAENITSQKVKKNNNL